MPPQWKVKPAITASGAGVWCGPGAKQAAKGIWLGTLAELVTGRTPAVWLATAKEQVIGLFGKRGSGKSFTLGSLLEGLCLELPADHVVRGAQDRAVLLFDPLDIYWTTRFAVTSTANAEANRHHALAKAAKLTDLSFAVEAWIPGEISKRPQDPSWFRLLTIPVPELGLDEWSALLETNVISDPIGQALTDALDMVIRRGFTSRSGEPIQPTGRFGFAELAEAIGSSEIQSAYHQETLRALRQRMASLDATGLFSDTGIPLREMLKAGRLAVILLGRLPSAYRAAVVAVLARRVMKERSEIAFAEKRLALDPELSASERSNLASFVGAGVPKTTVALDEAQTFLAPNSGSAARDIFIRLVKEGRNIGLSAVLATQQPSALDKRILSQVETFIAHQLVTEPDIDAVRANLKSAIPDKIEFGTNELTFSDLLRMLEPGQCVISAADMNTTLRRCVAVTVRPRASVHGGIEL